MRHWKFADSKVDSRSRGNDRRSARDLMPNGETTEDDWHCRKRIPIIGNKIPFTSRAAITKSLISITYIWQRNCL